MCGAAASSDRPVTSSKAEKGGAPFAGLRLLLCENPLPPLPEAIAAASETLPESNHYTEPYSAPLRKLIAERLDVAERLIHVNAGSELILRQLFDRFGRHAVLMSPTYALFPEIATRVTSAPLEPEEGFAFDLSRLPIPDGTTLVAIVNPNNPTGTVFDMEPLPALLAAHPRTMFLVDEAFIDFAGRSVVDLVPRHENLLVTRTMSKAHSLAGFRVGYAVVPPHVADELNSRNDAYPLALASQAAAIATLRHDEAIRQRVRQLRTWTDALARDVQAIGVRTFPSETYFFLANFSPLDAREIARELRLRDILIRPLADPRLGTGYMRVTTSVPEDNARFVASLGEVLSVAKTTRSSPVAPR